MGRNTLLVAMIGLAACNGDKDGDSGELVDPGNPCTVEVSSTVPSADAVDAYFRADIEFHLSEADETATWSLTDAGGAAVDGTSWLSEDGTVVYFTPSTDPLQQLHCHSRHVSRQGRPQGSQHWLHDQCSG